VVYFAKGLALSGKGFAEAVFGFRGVKVLAVGFGSGEDRILDPASVRVGVRVWGGAGASPLCRPRAGGGGVGGGGGGAAPPEVQSVYGLLGWRREGLTLLLRRMLGLYLIAFFVLIVRFSCLGVVKGLFDLTSLKSSFSLSSELSSSSTAISSEQSISLKRGAVRSGTSRSPTSNSSSNTTSSSELSLSFSTALGAFSRGLSFVLLVFWAGFCTWESIRCFFLGFILSKARPN